MPFGQGYAGGEPYSLLADNARLYVGSRGHALWARPLADLPALFADGFESGDLTAWSAFVP